MVIAILLESETKLADEAIEKILDQVNTLLWISYLSHWYLDWRSSIAITLEKDIGFHAFYGACIFLVTGQINLISSSICRNDTVTELIKNIELNMVCVEEMIGFKFLSVQKMLQLKQT